MQNFRVVPAWVLAGFLALSSCADPQDDSAQAGVTLLDQDTSNIVSSADIESMNGTYTTCSNRSGNWSLAVTGNPTLDNAQLSVIKGDGSCALAITAIRTGTDGLLAASAPLVLGTNFGSARAFGSPAKFYANAVLGSADFTGNFSLTLLFSADPRTANAGSNTASFATVNASSASATGVTAPNYTIDITGVTVTTDIAGVTATVLGNVVLTAGSATGDSYVIVSGSVADTYAAINTAFTGGTPVAMATTIAASSLLANGVNLTGGTVRTLIVAKITNGVASYQKFAITFNPPV